MKLIYRILILIGIFAVSLFYFGKNMKEKDFRVDTKTMEMEETTLPYISLLVEGQEVNLLHGYCSGLDELTVRESITPLTSEQSFSIIITENESTVKKVKYEILSLTDGKTVEEGAINALDSQPEYKLARIKLKQILEKETEYILKITLITDESKRIYFYTRIKTMDQFYLKEKLDFVKEFHEATFDKGTEEDISKYLEKPFVSATNYARVTINSDYNTITYGTLTPTKVFAQIPTISEIGKDTASIALEFVITVQTNTGLEYYRVKENYRFMYTANRCYLYDYIREMESVFDVKLTSLSKSEFKIGITNQPEIDLIANADKSSVAFVRERALWLYNIEDNKLTEIFSFYQEKTDFIRDTFDNHDIKILNLDASGDLDFIVYGYMNRGEYEGRVGVVLYHYDGTLQQVEEQIYIPINTTYEILKEELGNFCYRNQYDVLYLHIFNTIFSYNLTSKVLKVIANDVTIDSMVFSREGKFIAYQETPLSDKIHILSLEEEDTSYEIMANNQPLRLVGLIDENIIYGIASPSDVVISMDGTVLHPMQKIFIVDSKNSIKKMYSKEGYYVINAHANQNVVELDRIAKTTNGILEYEVTKPDYILNTASASASTVQVNKRVTDLMLTEYYISMGLTSSMATFPEVEHTVNTVITEDTTVRINRDEVQDAYYIAYAYGDIVALTPDLGAAIVAADQASGIVLDSIGQVIWERGVKSTKSSIEGISIIGRTDNITSLQACLQMLISYKNSEGGTYNRLQQSVITYLNQYLAATPVKVDGITLDETLHFIYKGKPVIGFKKTGDAVLIVGYDKTHITVIDPVGRTEKKLLQKDAATMFLEAGNIFVTYID
jgi:hypothetical protein